MSPSSHPTVSDRSAYFSDDTIAALATATGGAIAIVRLSGPGSFGALERLCGRAFNEARRLVLSPLRDGSGRLIDRAMVARFPGPHSFTGEDCAELHLHGGSAVVQRVLGALEALGIRQALPGEFSFRAVRNGKMTLSEATAVADLIAAENEGAATLALEKMSGSENKLLSAVVQEIDEIALESELNLDFSDQDVEFRDFERLKVRVRKIVPELERLEKSFERGVRLQSGVRVTFLGLPNSGKSSFFNALLGEDRAIVSSIAGTTRDILREKLLLRGSRCTLTVRLEDTAGLRSSSDEIESIGISRSLKAGQESDAVVMIVDGSRGIEEARHLFSLCSHLSSNRTAKLGILTKCDLLSHEKREKFLRELEHELQGPWVATSARTLEGIAEAARVIVDHCEHWVHRTPGEVLLTRAEELRAVQSALRCLREALGGPSTDLFASDLRHARTSLAAMVGKDPQQLSEELLNRIFSGFCIGK